MCVGPYILAQDKLKGLDIMLGTRAQVLESAPLAPFAVPDSFYDFHFSGLAGGSPLVHLKLF